MICFLNRDRFIVRALHRRGLYSNSEELAGAQVNLRNGLSRGSPRALSLAARFLDKTRRQLKCTIVLLTTEKACGYRIFRNQIRLLP
jgi:hypothetical protein